MTLSANDSEYDIIIVV